MIPSAIPRSYQSYQSAVLSFPRPSACLSLSGINWNAQNSLIKARQADRALDRYVATGLLRAPTGTKNKIKPSSLGPNRPLFAGDRGHRAPIGMYIHSISIATRRSRNSIGIHPARRRPQSVKTWFFLKSEIPCARSARLSRLDAQLKSNASVHKSGKYRRRIVRRCANPGAFDAPRDAPNAREFAFEVRLLEFVELVQCDLCFSKWK